MAMTALLHAHHSTQNFALHHLFIWGYAFDSIWAVIPLLWEHCSLEASIHRHLCWSDSNRRANSPTVMRQTCIFLSKPWNWAWTRSTLSQILRDSYSSNTVDTMSLPSADHIGSYGLWLAHIKKDTIPSGHPQCLDSPLYVAFRHEINCFTMSMFSKDNFFLPLPVFWIVCYICFLLQTK